MKYQDCYDVKEDFMKMLMEKEGVSCDGGIGYYLERYLEETDWRKRNVMRFCIYHYSAKLSDEELECLGYDVKEFDCDASQRAAVSFQKTYRWLEGYQIRRQKKGDGGESTVKYEFVKGEEYFRGDTMTSAWTILKDYVKKKTGVQVIDYKDEWEWFIIREADQIEWSDAMGEFLHLCHCMGNFLPVPAGFNVGRSGENAKWDSWDLTMLQIYRWYMDNSLEEIQRGNVDNKALERLFTYARYKEPAIKNCEIWLESFGTWERFVKENYLESFVKEDGTPKEFFEGHSLENSLPNTIDESEIFLQNVNECIRERQERLAEASER